MAGRLAEGTRLVFGRFVYVLPPASLLVCIRHRARPTPPELAAATPSPLFRLGKT